MKHTLKVVLCVFSLLYASTALAENNPLTPDALEVWADGVYQKAFDDGRLSGAAISVVKDGEIIFLRGYGYEDYGAETLVDPQTTRFRLASVSKLFTATALAQLIDQGELALDDPANDHLQQFQLPQSPSGAPLRVRHFVTHSPGLAKPRFGSGAPFDMEKIADGTPPSFTFGDAFYDRIVPSPIMEPGVVMSYCNFCSKVQGAIIEAKSGQSYRDYLKSNIFGPLGMANTDAPYEKDTIDAVARPYEFFPSGDVAPVRGFIHHPFTTPSGGVVSTAEDMAKFMAAHLAAGRDEDARLMSPEMFDTMHTPIFGNHPLTDQVGMNFFVTEHNGLTILEHEGSLPGFRTLLMLLPEENMGVFIASMGVPGTPTALEGLRHRFGLGETRLTKAENGPKGKFMTYPNMRNTFLYHFFGPYAPPRAPLSALAGDLSGYVGDYGDLRTYFQNLGAFYFIVNGRPRQNVEGQGGALFVDGDGPYEQIAPDLFWPEGEGAATDPFGYNYPVAFVRDEGAQVVALAELGVQLKAMEQFSSETLQRVLLISLIIIVTAFVTPFYGRGGGAVNLLNVLTAAAFSATCLYFYFVVQGGLLRAYSKAETGMLTTNMMFANLSAIFTIILTLSLLRSVFAKEGPGLLSVRTAHGVVIVLAAFTALYVFAEGRLLGFNVGV